MSAKPKEPGLSSPVPDGLENPSSVAAWPSLALGQFAQAKGGYGFPLESQGKKVGRYPFFKVSDMNLPANRKNMIDSNNWVDDDDLKALKAKTFPAGSVVFPKIGATILTNKKRLLVRDSVIDNNVMAVVIQDGSFCDSAFLYYWFQTIDLGRLANPGTVPSITSSRVHDSLVPVPPLPEQQKIAALLGVVQRAMEQQERLLALTAELKKTLLHQLFTQGLRHEPQKQTDIGPVPESWEVVKLVSLLREPLRNGHSARASNDGTGIRTLTLTAVTKRDFCDENTKLTVADPHRVRDMWLRNGDILIERANTPEYVGLSALYEGPDDWSIYSDLMIRVRLDVIRAMPYFVSEYLLTDPCRKYYQTHARSSAGNFPKIDQGTIEKTFIPLPPPDEQREIANALRAADSKLSYHRRKLATLTALFRTLLHQLMTAQIRVAHIDLPSLS